MVARQMLVAGFSSVEPAARQIVSVPVVVCEHLVALSRSVRQVLPSARFSSGPAGVAETTVKAC